MEQPAIKHVAVIGAGAWGTALARHLAEKQIPVCLWAHEPEVVRAIQLGRENTVYLPGVLLPPTLSVTNVLADAIAGADCLIFAVPSHVARTVLGRIGAGFAPMQLRLTVRRLQMGSWCIGMAQRALDMLVEHANQRVTFGERLADRQAIQWWVADAATKLHACRLMVMDAAVKQDEGRDVRMEASMIKVFATEMATEVIDHAQQAFGAMGVTQELPLSWLAQKVRTMRVYEGPSEVHRMVIARRVLGGR